MPFGQEANVLLFPSEAGLVTMDKQVMLANAEKVCMQPVPTLWRAGLLGQTVEIGY